MSKMTPRTTVFLLALLAFRYASAQEPETLKADDILKMSFRDLFNTKIVSASKSEQSIKDASATVRVVTADQIRARGYFTLEEALSDLPGFQFRNIEGFNSYVFMRGAPSQNNLILLLVDGVQINELNSGGFYGGGQFNLSDVERIEVVYGPVSALYGTNAVSGIVNLITRDPNDGSAARAGVLAGGFKTGMSQFRIRAGDAARGAGCVVSGMLKTSGKADLAGPKGDDNWSERMENFEKDLSLSFKGRLKAVETGILFQEKRASNTTYYKSTGAVYSDRNSLWDIAFVNGYAKYEGDLGDRLQLKSTFYYRNATVRPNTIDHVVKATESSPGSRVGYYRPGESAGLENQLIVTISPGRSVIAGAVFDVERLSDGFSRTESRSQNENPPEPAAPPSRTNRLFSYYVQADCRIRGPVSVVGGMRQDFSGYYGNVVTPRTGVVFNADNANVKLLYGEAFRAPKPWDFTYGTGNPGLEPEKMKSVELALSCPIRSRTILGASVFRNTIRHKLTKEHSSAGDRWVNSDRLNTRGFECSADYSSGRCSVYANYAYTDSRDQDGAFIPEISRHAANAGTTWHFGPGFRVNLRANYAGPRKNPFLIPNTGRDVIGGALVFDGCASCPVRKNVDLRIKLDNLFNRKYFHPCNLFEGRYRQPQRTFTVEVSYACG